MIGGLGSSAIAAWIDARLAAGEPGIITCSNLRRAYRRITIGDRAGVTLVYLQGNRQVIGERIRQRTHTYMPATLLDSQFETLEEPAADEHPVVVPVGGSLQSTVIELLRLTRRSASRRRPERCPDLPNRHVLPYPACCIAQERRSMTCR